MNIVLIAGFWLDGDSWGEVTEPLREAGHAVHALTLPGLESRESDRASISLRDHVDAVVAVVDSLEAPIVLVGHSGGGAIAHAVVDARPEAIARVIYVDSAPLGDGDLVNDELPVVGGEIPLPEWSVFDHADLVDLDDELRARFIAMAIPQPVRVATDRQSLGDARRYDVPVTVVCCEFPVAQLQEWLDAEVPFAAELGAVRDREFVDLPTGHWPQFTRPRELATIILSAVNR